MVYVKISLFAEKELLSECINLSVEEWRQINMIAFICMIFICSILDLIPSDPGLLYFLFQTTVNSLGRWFPTVKKKLTWHLHVGLTSIKLLSSYLTEEIVVLSIFNEELRAHQLFSIPLTTQFEPRKFPTIIENDFYHILWVIFI